MLNIGGGEVVFLVILAVVILGPSRLPHYASLLARGVRQLRDLAEGAKAQIREEMGPGFEDIDWRQLDPRQYDPRRIVREALATPGPFSRAGAADTSGQVRTGGGTTAYAPVRSASYDPSVPTPFDAEAT